MVTWPDGDTCRRRGDPFRCSRGPSRRSSRHCARVPKSIWNCAGRGESRKSPGQRLADAIGGRERNGINQPAHYVAGHFDCRFAICGFIYRDLDGLDFHIDLKPGSFEEPGNFPGSAEKHGRVRPGRQRRQLSPASTTAVSHASSPAAANRSRPCRRAFTATRYAQVAQPVE